MIARSFSRSRPIPFVDPLHEALGQSTRAVCWSPPSPHRPLVCGSPVASWMSRPLEGQHSANDGPHGPGTPAEEPALAKGPGASLVRGPRVPAPRQALARYDGPHSLSVRSSATGRHYRFPEQGAVQVIDAADIALMRRIEDITVL